MHASSGFLLAFVLFCLAPAARADEATPVKLAVGDAPPAYVGRQLGGAEVNLDLASGKAYVVSFWASWCGPCLQELPVLANIQQSAGADRMEVIAINIEEREAYRKLQRRIRDAGLTATYDPGRKARAAYGVQAIPHMIIVGRDGRISSLRVGYSSTTLDELADALNRALAIAPAPPNVQAVRRVETLPAGGPPLLAQAAASQETYRSPSLEERSARSGLHPEAGTP